MLVTFYGLVVWNTLFATILALLVFAICLTSFARRRPALMHTLWLLVLVKLIAPPIIPLQVFPAASASESAFTNSEVHLAFLSHLRPSNPPTPTSRSAAAVSADIQPLGGDSHNEPTVSNERGVAPKASALQLPFLQLTILSVWLSVTIAMIVRHRHHSKRICRLVQLAERAPDRIQRITDAAAVKMQVKGIQVGIADAPLMPFIWAPNRRATIILPRSLANDLTDEQLEGIICHELAHVSRRDTWFNSFGLLVTAVCWWHPVAWIAWREMRKSQELCCDELAIQRCSLQRKSYLQTLYQAVEFMQSNTLMTVSPASGFGDSGSLRKRFELLAAGRLVERNSWCICVALCGLCAALLCLPVVAHEQPKEVKQKKEKPSQIRSPQLYVHWIAPALKKGRKPILLRTFKVAPGKKFSVEFTDPNFKARKCKISGRITIRNGKTIGVVQATWKSGTEFRGAIRLGKLQRGKPLGVASAYHETRIAVTKNPSAKSFLKRAAYRARRPAAAAAADIKKPAKPGKAVKAISVDWKNVTSVDASLDTRWVLLGTKPGGVVLWDLATRKRKELHRPKQPSGPIEVVAFHRDSQLAATSFHGNSLQIWTVKTGKPVGRPLKLSSPATALIFSPDGNSLLVGTKDGSVQLWDFQAQAKRSFRQRIPKAVATLTFSHNGKMIAAGCHDKKAYVWTNKGELITELPHESTVTALAFTEDGIHIATGCQDTTVRQWVSATGKLHWKPRTHQGSIDKLIFSYNNKILWVAESNRNTVREGKDGSIISRLRFKSKTKPAAYITLVTSSRNSRDFRKHVINFVGGR